MIDDEPLAAALIAKYVERTPFLQSAGTFSDAAEALKTIREEAVQLVFLDIEMPQLSGMEFAKILPPGVRMIFITAYDRYAVEGFRVNAIDYLLKPVSYDEFLQSALRAESQISPTNSGADAESEYITVKCEYETRRIPSAEIIAIEGVKNYVKIHIENSDDVLTLITMKAIEQTLPDNFVRVHRSYIVNTRKITARRANLLRLVNGISVPIGETYRNALKNI